MIIVGTLRPDLIESASALASGKADSIKTHHNDTDLVRELRKKVQVTDNISSKNLGNRLSHCYTCRSNQRT